MTTAVAERISHIDVERLIEAAAQAPSPDNNQPWQFTEREGTLRVYHDASRALPSDAGGMFSAIALGAAIENICIAASQVGLRARVRYAELSEHELQRSPQAHVATIGFERDDYRDPLGPAALAASRMRCSRCLRTISGNWKRRARRSLPLPRFLDHRPAVHQDDGTARRPCRFAAFSTPRVP